MKPLGFADGSRCGEPLEVSLPLGNGVCGRLKDAGFPGKHWDRGHEPSVVYRTVIRVTGISWSSVRRNA